MTPSSRTARRRSRLRPVLALLLAATAVLPAWAAVPAAQQLNVYRDGTPTDWLQGNHRWLGDGFDNGDPLTGPFFAGSSIAAPYSLQGLDSGADQALALREQDSALLLDARYGAVSPNAQGLLGRSLRLRLLSNVVDTNSGLAKTRSFAAALQLSLTDLPALGYSFGLRLSDGFSNNNDVVELFVVGGATNDTIVFRKQDFATGSINLLGSAPLTGVPAEAQSLALVLSHSQADSNDIFGLYGYIGANGVLLGDLTPFTRGTTAFDGEDHTRIELRATAPVPEPAAWALMAGGLGGLAWAARRRRQPH